jgi:hypothetical protein
MSAVTIALGIVMAVVIIVVVPILIMAAVDWRFWRCWALKHRWIDVEPFTHSTGVLSTTKRHRCKRCDAVPTIWEEMRLEAER